MRSTYAIIEPAPEPRPGPTENSVLARPADKIPNDQKIAGIVQIANRVQFVFEAAADFLAPSALAVAFASAAPKPSREKIPPSRQNLWGFDKSAESGPAAAG